LSPTAPDVHDRLALPAVDRDVGAVDEARARRREEGDEVGDLFGLADAPERDALLRQLVRRLLLDAQIACEGLLERVPARGVDRAGVDGVDADAVAPVLLRQRRREVEVRRVGGARPSSPSSSA
jgi:hypothetical protein